MSVILFANVTSDACIAARSGFAMARRDVEMRKRESPEINQKRGGGGYLNGGQRVPRNICRLRRAFLSSVWPPIHPNGSFWQPGNGTGWQRGAEVGI